MAAAAKVFSEKGFGGSSLEDVATEVGMLKGSLYNYIESKEDLLFAVVRPHAEELLDQARSLASSDLPAPEKLRRIVEVQVGIIDQNLAYVSVYVQEIIGKGISPEWTAIDQEYVAHVEQMVRDGIEEGTLDATSDPRMVVRAMLGALNWMTRWYEPGGPARVKATSAEMSDVFLAGLLSRRGR